MKNTKEKLNEVGLTEIEDVNMRLFSGIWHHQVITNGMKDLLRITDPSRMDNNINVYAKKRNDAKYPHISTYWHNKMSDLFQSVSFLMSNMRNDDEKYWKIKIEDIKKIYDLKREEHNMILWRRDNIKSDPANR